MDHVTTDVGTPMPGNAILTAAKVYNALTLMQEMANALEDTCLTQHDKVDYMRANRVLDDYRTWK